MTTGSSKGSVVVVVVWETRAVVTTVVVTVVVGPAPVPPQAASNTVPRTRSLRIPGIIGREMPLPSRSMQPTVMLHAPGREPVVRGVRDGTWDEPHGGAGPDIGDGLWALPGLVDAHAHLAKKGGDHFTGGIEAAEQNARAALAAGVGLVLDKGWSDLTVTGLIDLLVPGERPEIEAAGIINTVEDGYWPGFGREIQPGGIAEAVARAADEGRGWVKLIGDWPRKGLGPLPNFSEDELARAVEVATARGSSVAVHTMAREVPSMAVRAGAHSIEHGLFLDDSDLAALGARGGSWVPTVAQVEALIAQLGADSSGGRLMREGLANVAGRLASAVEAGVHVLTGTDLALDSRDVAKEAIRLWEMGMDAGLVVEAASTAGYLATGRSPGFGIGQPANAVLFSEDPSLDPRALAHPRHVIRLGEVVR